MYFTVELARGSPQYTFTCISTGRPVYNVLWYIRYYDYYRYYNYYGYNNYIDGEAVLNDSMTAQYISTLTVTELEKLYECDVYTYTFPFGAYSGLKIEGN